MGNKWINGFTYLRLILSWVVTRVYFCSFDLVLFVTRCRDGGLWRGRKLIRKRTFFRSSCALWG